MAKKKVEENNYIGLFFVAIGVFVIAMFFISYYLFNYVEPTTKYFPAYNKIVENKLSDQLMIQNSMNDEFKKASEDKLFTLDNPYIKYNPYGLNPLSAIIIFSTEEETEIKLYINDKYIVTYDKTKSHVIPVYGLYGNFENKVTVELSDGTKKDYSVVALPCDDNIGDIDTKKLIKKNEDIMFLGNVESSDSHIRGFDYYGNVVYSLDFPYIDGVSFYNNRIAIKYNSFINKNTKMPSLKLELDYLGQIYYISDNTSDLDNINKYKGLDSYYYTTYDINKNYAKNYEFVKAEDYGNDTVGIERSLSYYKDDLINAPVYEKKYKLSTNGDYITYEFNDAITLIMVFENSSVVHEYNLYETNMIKVPREKDASLFVKVDNKYYSLVSTLKK